MPSDDQASQDGRDHDGSLVLRSFGRVPTLSASVWTAIVFGWIAIGTVALTPVVAGSGSTATRDFVRDGLVRWPGALLLLVLLWKLRPNLPIDLTGGPKRPVWFPWATITLTVAALIRLTVVSQFWDEAGYTVATFFSEMSTGVFEELAFRGLVFGGLLFGFGSSRGGVRKALLLTTVLFGLVHGASGIPAVIVTLLFGAVFLLSTLELRSLWPAAVLHGLFDVGVNGAAPVGESAWNETLMAFASVALLLGGIVALVFFGLWNRWPVVPDQSGP